MRTLILSMFICVAVTGFSQVNNKGWFSLGARSTVSAFSHDGFGLGTGGQFRIRFSNQVNTDWFADFISINLDNKVKSDYYHIGWSVLFYPFSKKEFNTKVTPYFLAGHCFDYNRKMEIRNTANLKDRWGSAVQAGIGAHFNLTERFDVSLTTQYMIHFTNEIEYEETANGDIVFENHSHGNALEGHLLTTLSLNYKIVKLWGRN
ncbi:MAG: hypothetical protein ACO1O6_04380 [Bacteroidota bacterium]